MNRERAIIAAFQRKHLLTVKNEWYQREIELFFDREIQGEGKDLTSELLLFENRKITAKIIAKQSGIVAGIEEVSYWLKKQGLRMVRKKEDGQTIHRNETILMIEGRAKDIVKYERSVINLLQRMSGIATYTSQLKKKFRNVAATRKTVLRFLDKKAVAIGGGLTHRLSLMDGILIKDNHIALGALWHLKKLQNINSSFIEIEIQKPNEVLIIANMLLPLKVNAQKILMLDNFTPHEIRGAIIDLKKARLSDHFLIEASGGITEKNISQYKGVDVISVGSLTHSVNALDMSLEIIH